MKVLTEAGWKVLDVAAGGQGAVGPQGPAGRDGKDGKDGADGAAGAQGEKGEKGDRGPAGQKGAQGVQGPLAAMISVTDPGPGTVVEHNGTDCEVVLTTTVLEVTTRTVPAPIRLGQFLSLVGSSNWAAGSEVTVDFGQPVSLSGKSKVKFSGTSQSAVLIGSVSSLGAAGVQWRLLMLDGAELV